MLHGLVITHWRHAISPDDIHFGESDSEPFGPDALLFVVGWIASVMVASWLAHLLRLSETNALRLWACFNAVPVAWVLLFRPLHVSTLLGLAVLVAFSWAIGRAIIEGPYRKRAQLQKLLDEDVAWQAAQNSLKRP